MKDKSIIDIFISRDGIETKVELKNGRLVSIWNIAWGYDIGDAFAHITTNISPNIDNAQIDFFFTNEISRTLTRSGKNYYTAGGLAGMPRQTKSVNPHHKQTTKNGTSTKYHRHKIPLSRRMGFAWKSSHGRQ